MPVIMDLLEIEDLVCWNLSFDVSVEDTLLAINRMDLFNLFENILCY